MKSIFEKFNSIAKDHALHVYGNDIMIYPCGLAWIYLEVPQTDSLGKMLEEEGLLSWDSFSRSYRHWINEHNQSYLHKFEHANKLAQLLTAEFKMPFKFMARLD